MEGRTSDQKRDLSSNISVNLNSEFPKVPIISRKIRDFEKATYANKSMV